MIPAAIALTDIGWKAQTALEVARGRARVLAPLSASIYLTAGHELVWLGREGDILHPRAMLTASSIPTGGDIIALDPAGARAWTPPAATPSPGLAGAARALLDLLRGAHHLPPPRGLGALLVGGRLPFHLAGAVSPAAALARACARDQARDALRPGEQLLGLGPGLTPSGDDFVGGVLFARRLVGGPAWASAAAALIECARARTNEISRALLADLADGHGHEPLHTLAATLGQGTLGDVAVDAVRRLDRLGHCSGWDMLAGFLAGLAGPDALFEVQ